MGKIGKMTMVATRKWLEHSSACRNIIEVLGSLHNLETSLNNCANSIWTKEAVQSIHAP